MLRSERVVMMSTMNTAAGMQRRDGETDLTEVELGGVAVKLDAPIYLLRKL